MKINFLILLSIILCIRLSAQEKIYYGDCKNGFGVKIAGDKSNIYGNYKNGRLNGYGLVLTADGNIFAGFLKDDLCWGKGILLYSKGYIYVGDYVKNAQQGKGTMFVINTQIVDGTWENNEPAQVNKITTQNQKSLCLLGDCEKGPGLIFTDVKSFSCVTADMIVERRPDDYMYFGPRNGEGYMSIMTKNWIYVGMGKDRKPFGEGGMIYSKSKIEYGNWRTITIGDEETPVSTELNKPCPIQVNLLEKFKLPINESVRDLRISNDGKKAVICTGKKSFGFYDVNKKTWTLLSGTDVVDRIEISGNGQYGAYCTETQIKVFDLKTSKLLIAYNDTVYNNFILSPDGQCLIYSTAYPSYIKNIDKAKVLNFKTGKILTEFFTEGSAGDVGHSFDEDSIFYYERPYFVSKNNYLYSYDMYFGILDPFQIHNCFTGERISINFDTTMSHKEYGTNKMLGYSVSPEGNRLMLFKGDKFDIYKIREGKKQTWYPELTVNVDRRFRNREMKDMKVHHYSKISTMYLTNDGKGLVVKLIGSELVIIDLRTKTPDNPLYSKAIGTGIYSFPADKFRSFNNTYDGSRFYFNTKDGTVFVYEVKFN